jgi:biopolymer transport protein ExbB/TolQ
MFKLIGELAAGFHAGGIWMWAILICQIFSITIIIERVIALYLKRKPNQVQRAFMYENEVKSGQLSKVVDMAEKMGASDPLANVTLVGAKAAIGQGGKEEIQLKMDEILVENNQRLEKRTGFLSMIANVATLIGLLGTIIGMIESFSSLSAASATERAALLAKGISMAMNATAYGLIVAVPSLVAYSILSNRSQQLVDDLNKAAMKVFIWMTYSFENVSPRSKKN